MSNGQNTGRRYIPKFFTYDGSTEWRPNVAYSAKTIVTKNFKVYTSIVNVPSNVGVPEDNPKYWQPAVISDEVMQTIIDELGKLDGDVSEFEHRVQVLENEVGELEIVIGDVQDDVDQLKNALTAVEIVDSASGAIASFTDGSDGVPVKGLTVSMEPIQAGSGDPSPDNVRPISGRDSVTVTRTGFNVWDEEWENGSYSTSSGTKIANANKVRNKNLIQVLPNTTYFCKMPSDVVGLNAFWYDKNQKFVFADDGYGIRANSVFTVPDGCYYLAFSTFGTSYITYNHDISINYPSTDHDYHAYQGQSIEVQLGQTVYGGTLDVTQGVLTVDRAYEEFDLSTKPYSTVNGYDNWTITLAHTSTGASSAQGKICNLTEYIYAGSTINKNHFYLVDTTVALYLQEGIARSAIASFAYPLATPVTVHLTTQQLTTLLGQNNVWSDADSVAVDYVADTKLYIAKVIADALS